MPPIVSIVGKSKVGKTTLIERLVGELKSRGYRVATVKHAPEGFAFDTPSKDSWRHLQAGSYATAIGSSNRVVVIRAMTGTPNLKEVAHLLGEDYDIILAEGFKHDDAPKIEVHRREVGPPLDATKKLIAVVTDEPVQSKIKQFSLEDIRGLADFLEKGFIEPQRERLSLYINGASIPLTLFPRKIISNTLLGMVSSLKGVGEVKSLEIFLGKKPKS